MAWRSRPSTGPTSTPCCAPAAFPLILPVLDPSAAHEALDRLDGLLLSGGGDIDPAVYGAARSPHTDQVDPARDAFEIALVRRSHRAWHPRARCLPGRAGHQRRPGRHPDPAPPRCDRARPPGGRAASPEKVHDVKVLHHSRLASVVGPERLGVNTLHHQAVAEVGAGLRVARGPRRRRHRGPRERSTTRPCSACSGTPSSCPVAVVTSGCSPGSSTRPRPSPSPPGPLAIAPRSRVVPH